MGSALQARVGIAVEEVLENKPEDDMPSPSGGDAAFKALKEYFKGIKDTPTWFSEWKERRQQKMLQKLEGKNAAAEEKGNGEEEQEPTDRAANATGADEPAEAPEAATAEDALKFKVGDSVMGKAAKHKEKYAKRGRIVSVLARHYKLHMLEGEIKGDEHKFLHRCVQAIDDGAASASDGAAAPAVTPATERDDVGMRDIENLFGSG